MRRACLFLALLTVLPMVAMGRARPVEHFSHVSGEYVPESDVAGFGGNPAFAGTWLLRHAVHLTVPGQNLAVSFSGVMRLDADAGTLHAVGLGGMGLTLFDLTVTGDAFAARFLHPSIVRLPGAGEYIAAALRGIWLKGDPARPVLSAAFSGYGKDGFGPWPETVSAVWDGFTLEITLLEARRL